LETSKKFKRIQIVPQESSSNLTNPGTHGHRCVPFLFSHLLLAGHGEVKHSSISSFIINQRPSKKVKEAERGKRERRELNYLNIK
jgi:hypothetical protein